MMNLITYVFWIFLIYATIFMGLGFYYGYRKPRKEDLDYLDRLYNQIWTRADEDRIYAWDRVIAHLKAFSQGRALIEEAEHRKQALSKQYSDTMEIDEEGRLIYSGNRIIKRRPDESYINFLRRLDEQEGTDG